MITTTMQPKSVIITGGGSGIGLAVLQHFASQGCQIAVLDVNDAVTPLVVSQLNKDYPSASEARPNTTSRTASQFF